MKLSIILPVYNEVRTIGQIVRRVLETDYEKEVVIVDDGSSDGTREFLKENIREDKNIHLVYHNVNMGKATAIRTALDYVTGDIVIIQDADGEYSPADYKHLIAPIVAGEVNVVYGSRFLSMDKYLFMRHWFANMFLGGHYRVGSMLNLFGLYFLNLLVLLLYNIKLTDIATGYKVFKTDIIKGEKLTSNRFEFCYEITAKIAKKKIRIKEVPVNYRPRSRKEGKKLTWIDGIWATLSLIRYRFRD